MKRYGLDTYYEGKVKGIAPVDEGIPIETEVGTLYGLKSVYDADWIIHAHHTDVREVHFHRQIDKAVKPFGMSYARIETRSTYHQNLGPRAANFTARAIFESEFVQSKFAFAAFLNVGPHGVIGVDADNDLYAVNDRATFIGCQIYGKIMTLFGEIDECIAALDFPCPVPYVFSAAGRSFPIVIACVNWSITFQTTDCWPIGFRVYSIPALIVCTPYLSLLWRRPAPDRIHSLFPVRHCIFKRIPESIRSHCLACWFCHRSAAAPLHLQGNAHLFKKRHGIPSVKP